MSTVWIPKSAGHDFTAAGQYGVIKFIFEDSQDLFNPDRLREIARQAIQNAEPTDYLLPSGPQIMNIMVFMALLERNKYVRLLLFNAKDNAYRERCYYEQRRDT